MVSSLLMLSGCASDKQARSAEQKPVAAATTNGMAYATGQGVTQDYKQAMKLFQQGAQAGDAEAQYQLGLIYGSGKDFQHNYVEAYKWYALAAAQGHELAIRARGSIARKLSHEQLIDGQRKAAEFAATVTAESKHGNALFPDNSDTEAIAKARKLMRQEIKELNKEASAGAPAAQP